VCYDCRLFYFHKASGTFQWDQQSQGLVDGTVIQEKIAGQLLERDTLLLHGSTVAVDGQAYLFTAPCHTGKSTHTRLWRELFGDRAEEIVNAEIIYT
jgi:hypothetical protein